MAFPSYIPRTAASAWKLRRHIFRERPLGYAGLEKLGGNPKMPIEAGQV